MIFIDDIIPGLPWLTPAPIGTVEDGWAGIVSDMLRDVARALASHPSATIDVLGIARGDGTLSCDLVVDGTDDAGVGLAVAAAAVRARDRAAATSARCGLPGHLRRDRPAWPTTRCDRHADGAHR